MTIRLKAFVHPANRARYAMSVIWLLCGVIGIAAHRASMTDPIYLGFWIVTILWLPVWTMGTIVRLQEVGRTKWLILAHALPWSALVWVLAVENRKGHIGRSLEVALAIVIASELPLILIPGQDRSRDRNRAEEGNP